MLKDKTYMLVSNVGYPFGGGEQFLYQTINWANNLGMKSYWLSFSKPMDKHHTEFKIFNQNNCTMIYIPHKLQENNLYNWLKLLNPDIIHHQGHFRQLFSSVCSKLRIPILTGFHFWIDAIVLNPDKKNIDILENYKYHKKDPVLDILVENKYTYIYVVSKFVSDVIQKITDHDLNLILSSSSSIRDYQIPKINPVQNKYCTIINIHSLKGGKLFLYLLKKLPKIPFLAVRTEPDDTDLDKEIEILIKSRKHCIFMERTEDIKSVYKKKTRISSKYG